MELLRKHETSEGSRPKSAVSQAADQKIRYHLERSIFYDPTLVQAHYNLALFDYRQNSLHSATRHHLQRVLQLQPGHFKAQLMLCDLAVEMQSEISDQNLFEAVRCYTKLLDSQLDLRDSETAGRRAGDLSESSKSNESKVFAGSYGSDEPSDGESTSPGIDASIQVHSDGINRRLNEDSKELKSKVMSLAHHNLCTVLGLINSQLMTSNATMNVSAYCSSTDLPSASLVQPIHFQVPAITST